MLMTPNPTQANASLLFDIHSAGIGCNANRYKLCIGLHSQLALRLQQFLQKHTTHWAEGAE
jgi:hypothetical protein